MILQNTVLAVEIFHANQNEVFFGGKGCRKGEWPVTGTLEGRNDWKIFNYL